MLWRLVEPACAGEVRVVIMVLSVVPGEVPVHVLNGKKPGQDSSWYV